MKWNCCMTECKRWRPSSWWKGLWCILECGWAVTYMSLEVMKGLKILDNTLCCGQEIGTESVLCANICSWIWWQGQSSQVVIWNSYICPWILTLDWYPSCKALSLHLLTPMQEWGTLKSMTKGWWAGQSDKSMRTSSWCLLSTFVSTIALELAHWMRRVCSRYKPLHNVVLGFCHSAVPSNHLVVSSSTHSSLLPFT